MVSNLFYRQQWLRFACFSLHPLHCWVSVVNCNQFSLFQDVCFNPPGPDGIPWMFRCTLGLKELRCLHRLLNLGCWTNPGNWLTHTVPHPGTVVVKLCDAAVAHGTVFGPDGLPYLKEKHNQVSSAFFSYDLQDITAFKEELTKQVLQNMLRSKLPVSANSTIVWRRRRKKNWTENIYGLCYTLARITLWSWIKERHKSEYCGQSL